MTFIYHPPSDDERGPQSAYQKCTCPTCGGERFSWAMLGNTHMRCAACIRADIERRNADEAWLQRDLEGRADDGWHPW